jgi:hypothetical protein
VFLSSIDLSSFISFLFRNQIKMSQVRDRPRNVVSHSAHCPTDTRPAKPIKQRRCRSLSPSREAVVFSRTRSGSTTRGKQLSQKRRVPRQSSGERKEPPLNTFWANFRRSWRQLCVQLTTFYKEPRSVVISLHS